MRGFERMLSYEQYPEEKSRLWLSSLKKKLISLHGGLLNVTTNIHLKSCAYHPDSECCCIHGNLSDPKSSENTLLYLYVIWSMLKSADLHETILTPVICHKHVRYHDGVTLYFSVKFPSVASKKTRSGYFSYMSADFRAFSSKNNQKKKQTRKTSMDARKRWEFESINRNLSAALLHVKPSCNNSDLNDTGVSLQIADLGSYHFLVIGTKIFRIIWKLSENC